MLFSHRTNYLNLLIYFHLISMSTSDHIQILPLSSAYRQSVINLLLSSFFIEEPINERLKFNIPQEVLSWAEYLVDTGIHDQCSFIALDTNSSYQHVIGVILNGISIQNQTQPSPHLESEKLKFIMQLIDDLMIGYDLFELCQTDRLFHSDVINVDSNYRGLHLSNRLIEVSDEKAKQMGFKGAFVICTSLFSKLAFQRQGYHVIHERSYTDYGQGFLTDMGLHDRYSLLYKKIDK